MQALGDKVWNERRVLKHFGVEALGSRRVRRGRNTHWIVRTPTSRYVLRRYNASCTHAEVTYEHTVLRHLHARGWPVAPPITDILPTPAGMWCLFTYIPGRQRAPRTSAGRYAEEVERGRLLAQLHQDFAPLARLGQREGWKTTPEGLYDREGKPSVLTVLTEFAQRDAERGSLLLAFYEQATEKLMNLPLGDAPLIPLHGDFTRWNMHYRGGTLSGIFDFDSTHLDLRVADFVLSWRGTYGGILEGYREVSPLSDLENALLVPIFWQFMVSCAVGALEENGNPDWALKQLQRQPFRSRL